MYGSAWSASVAVSFCPELGVISVANWSSNAAAELLAVCSDEENGHPLHSPSDSEPMSSAPYSAVILEFIAAIASDSYSSVR